MVTGVIFDLDGVILHTDEYHYLAWKHIADEERIYFDREINNRLRGVSRIKSLDIILEKANRIYSEEEKERLATRKNGIYVELLNEKLSPAVISEDVKYTLKELRKRGIKLAIGSSSKNAKLILQRVQLTDDFHFISDGNGITKSKPDPEVFLKAAEGIGCMPKDCFVVEDAFAGIDASIAGGFQSIAIGDAKAHKGANYRIERLSEIIDLISKD